MPTICERTALALPSAEAVEQKPASVCAVDQALQIARTAYRASCGKGVFCRDGLCQLCRILEEVTRDKGTMEDLELLKELCSSMVTAEDCAHSVAAAALISLSLERHWDEWSDHITRKRCAALMCPPFYSVYIDPALCTGCGACLSLAPKGAVAGGEDLVHVVVEDNALKTPEFSACCPVSAIQKCGPIKPPLPEEPVPVGSFSGGMRRRRRGGAPAADQ